MEGDKSPSNFKFLIMRKILIVLFIFYACTFCAQNHVKNYSFEDNLIPFNEFYTWHSASSFGYNFIDSLSNHWFSLYGSSFTFNKNYQERDVYKNIKTNSNHSRFYDICIDKPSFDKNSFAYLMSSFRSLDTIKFKPRFWIENTGNPDDSAVYWGNNSVILSNLNRPLTKDTTYIISYRLLSGEGIGKDRSRYNFINNFGVHFSVNNLGDSSIKPYNRLGYKVKGIKEVLQDTILDTTLNWRLVKREFKADSFYNYIYFGQFLDNRKNKFKISKTFFQDYGFWGGGEFTVSFAFFLDNIRLLPKWQYLDITPDINACEGDSVELKVFSGAGGYKWILSSLPNKVLSTLPSIKIKADTTSMFQVMSPYDTASIMVYVTKPVYDSISIISCGQYLWRGKWRSTAGVYKDTAMNNGVCKSFYTLNFKRTLNNKVTILDSIELRADQDSVSYQWYSCNPWTRLDGESKRTIKGSKGKTYAVVLNNGKGCIDTSNCISLGGSSIVSEEKLDWRVFPNPFQEAFRIVLDKIYHSIGVKLYNMNGQLILNEYFKKQSVLDIQNSSLPSGSYYLQIEAEGSSKFFNIQKE